MSDLEDRIRATASGGFFLTLALDRDIKSGKWRASYRNTDNSRVNIELDDDPVRAIVKAISPLRQPKPETTPVSSHKKRARADEDII